MHHPRTRLVSLVAVVGLLSAGCSSGDGTDADVIATAASEVDAQAEAVQDGATDGDERADDETAIDEQAGDGQPGSETDEDESVAQVGVFFVDGPDAYMSGEIDGSTPDDVRQLIDEHPQVTTIVLEDVPGSSDDDANLEASRLVRVAGLNTHVDGDGSIASGGVDFYLAGLQRTFDDGAMFGVHSWASSDGVEGKDIPRDDPEHRLYLDYYDEIGVAADFYWFTLEAAPADDIHIMTADELATYGFSTQ